MTTNCDTEKQSADIYAVKRINDDGYVMDTSLMKGEHAKGAVPSVLEGRGQLHLELLVANLARSGAECQGYQPEDNAFLVTCGSRGRSALPAAASPGQRNLPP